MLRALEFLVHNLLQNMGSGSGFDDLDLPQHLFRSPISQGTVRSLYVGVNPPSFDLATQVR